MSDYRDYYRRNLPHWQPKGATFFVTFRLKGSLPMDLLKPVQGQPRPEMDAFYNWDTLLGQAGPGPRWLAQPKVAVILLEALHHRDGKVFDLFAFCIMPNHVHIVLEPLEQEQGAILPLNVILQSLKRFTARRANIFLGRKGPFWQEESYDHVIRDEGEFERIVSYVLENPVKARLAPNWEAWPWTFFKSEGKSPP